jgi:hypothetical protein
MRIGVLGCALAALSESLVRPPGSPQDSPPASTTATEPGTTTIITTDKDRSAAPYATATPSL